MSSLSVSDIEHSLLLFRKGRSIILEKILRELVQCEEIKDKFQLVSRFFSRLKSADSILEKIKRKRIEINNVNDLPNKLPDILGFRIITADVDELQAATQIIYDQFEIINKIDRIKNPGLDGEREINFELEYTFDNLVVPFEIQLRTYLQHFFSIPTFHLFHKKPPESRTEYRNSLRRLSTLLQKVEELSQEFSVKRISYQIAISNYDILPLNGKINLVVVEHESETFVNHVVIDLTDNVEKDNELIANTKVDLYSKYPNHSIVECSCLNFTTYVLNEPQVFVPVDNWKNIKL